MNASIKRIALTSLAGLALYTGAAMAHYEYGCGNPMMGGQMMGGPMMGGPMMGGQMMNPQYPMARMQEMMRQNQSIMQRMVDEPDLEKRRQLMQQHMQSMHGQMAGYGQMMGHGHMMGQYMNPGSAAVPSPEQMQQHMEMMQQRMNMMQQMFERMQQNQAQQT